MTRANHLKRAIFIAAACLWASPVTCHSIFAKRTVAPDDDEYELVAVSGSMIPQRVKKGQQAESTSPISTLSSEALEKLRMKPQTVGKSAGGT